MSDFYTTIGDIAEVFDGPHATPKKLESGPYFLSISSLEQGALDLSKSAHLSDQDFIKWTKRVTPRSGDVLFSYETRLGDAALMPSGVKACLGRRMGLLRPNIEKVIPEYLLYAYLSPSFQAVINSRTIHGATVNRIALRELPSFPIRIPNKEEQLQVVNILKNIDKKIEINKKTNRTLEQIAQAIFKSWFVDFEPTKAKVAAREALLADTSKENKAQTADKIVKAPSPEIIANAERKAAIQAVSGISGAGGIVPTEQLEALADLFPNQLVESELGEIPEGWGVKSLDKVAHYQNGLALQKFRPEKGEKFLPVLKISHLKAGFTDGKEVAKASIKPECIIDNGDVVFSWSASLLVDIWCGGKAALNQHLFKVTSKEYPKWFYTMWTKHHLEQFIQIASDKAVTMGHIKRSHLSEAKCAIPTNDFIELPIIGALIDKQINTRLESNTLEQLRDSLLPKLLSGEIDLTNNQKEMANA